MDAIHDREQARFFEWAHRPDIGAAAPELARVFYWIAGHKCDSLTSDRGRVAKAKSRILALLMLAHDNNDTWLALEFESATEETIDFKGEQFGYLQGEDWVVLVVRSAENARLGGVRYLNTALPPL